MKFYEVHVITFNQFGDEMVRQSQFATSKREANRWAAALRRGMKEEGLDAKVEVLPPVEFGGTTQQMVLEALNYAAQAHLGGQRDE